MTNQTAQSLLDLIVASNDQERFRDLNWRGSFADYLDLLRNDPRIGRSAFQRVYDMIVSFGSTRYRENKIDRVHYHFFDDPIDNGKDAVFGLDDSLTHLVDIFKAAARRYGTERRVLLLHGPVGSAKSTIVRMLKKDLVPSQQRRPAIDRSRQVAAALGAPFDA